MKRHRISLLSGMILLAAPILGPDLASRRGRPAPDVLIEDAVLEDGRLSMTAGQAGKETASKAPLPGGAFSIPGPPHLFRSFP